MTDDLEAAWREVDLCADARSRRMKELTRPSRARRRAKRARSCRRLKLPAPKQSQAEFSRSSCRA